MKKSAFAAQKVTWVWPFCLFSNGALVSYINRERNQTGVFMKKTTMIKSNRKFRYLYNRGKSLANPWLALYVLKNKQGQNTLGITVNKKIGKAVVRNRIKRLIKESYRLMEDQIKDGYDVIVVSRFKMAHADFHKTDRALRDLARKLDILEEKP